MQTMAQGMNQTSEAAIEDNEAAIEASEAAIEKTESTSIHQFEDKVGLNDCASGVSNRIYPRKGKRQANVISTG